MKIFVNLVSYNGMGGHPTLSFVGDLVLGKSSPSFGDAFASIEAYIHLDTASPPLAGLDFMRERFQRRVATMPRAWVRRKTKRIEVAFFSLIGDADELLQSRSRPALLGEMPLIRAAYRELVRALDSVRRRVNASDDFNVGAFLDFLRMRESLLDGASDREIQEWLCELQEIERRRVGR